MLALWLFACAAEDGGPREGSRQDGATEETGDPSPPTLQVAAEPERIEVAECEPSTIPGDYSLFIDSDEPDFGPPPRVEAWQAGVEGQWLPLEVLRIVDGRLELGRCIPGEPAYAWVWR